MFTDAKTLTLLSAAFLAGSSLVSAHGHVQSWNIGGETKNGFNPSNPPQYGPTAERPTDNSDQGFADYTTGIVACGGLSAGSGLETWDVNAGDSVTANWNTWPDSHKGPVTEYMAACPASGCDGVDAASLQWFKIAEDTFDGTQWPSDKIVSTLAWTFKIPSDLAAGPYLVRHDIIAMHSTGAPQVYPVCFQANLISSGSAVPTDTVTFPEAYNINDDFKTWSLYGGDQTAFVPPGPPVYNGGSSAPQPSTSASAAPSSAEPSSAVPSSTDAAAPSSTDASAPEESAAPTSTDASASEESVAPTSTEAVDPVETSAAPEIPVESTSDAEYPSGTLSQEYPAETSAAASSSSAATPAPTSETPGTVPLGGAAPPVTQNGNRWDTLGGSYFDEASAVRASCMEQMNRCKRWANGLPNSEVSAALNECDAQESSCEASGANQKRASILERYARRGLRFF
ncbi:hypothetical protein I317_02760 [Kwoniella heveanensis CBS 569]|nr:hypothetical protein I317_02760 [Kwoniella heveanensis CBS 569]